MLPPVSHVAPLPPNLQSITTGPAALTPAAAHADEAPAHAAKSAGREGLRRLLEHERYRIRFSIQSPARLREVLASCAADYQRSAGKTRLAIVCGGGIVGYTAAIRLKQQYNCNVIVLEKRTEATRKTVLDLKRSTLKEWPADLVAQLVHNKYLTRSACRAEEIAGKQKLRPASSSKGILADLAEPQSRYYPHLLWPHPPLPPTQSGAATPWAYPLPGVDDNSDFYDTYAIAQTRDLQAGMNAYCLAQGIHVLHGTIGTLERGDGEFIAAMQLAGSGTDDGEHDPVRPPANLPAVIVIAEGRTARLDEGFGGIDEIRVNEIWHQRNFKVERYGKVPAHPGGSAIRLDPELGSVVTTQIWDGPDGLQANVSAMRAPGHRAAAGTPADQRQLDQLFGQVQPMLDRFGIPLTIVPDSETFRSPPIPVVLTRARNPVHDNVIFVGDSAGLSSPFTSRSANDGVIGQLRILEEYLCDPGYQSAAPDVRRGAQERARAKFNAVYRVRHGTALDMLLQYGFYTARQAEEIRASFARERSVD